jgi:hypothetical protein
VCSCGDESLVDYESAEYDRRLIAVSAFVKENLEYQPIIAASCAIWQQKLYNLAGAHLSSSIMRPDLLIQQVRSCQTFRA